MSKINVTITMHVKWWVKYYVCILQVFCDTFNCEPDYDRVSAFISRYGVTVK